MCFYNDDGYAILQSTEYRKCRKAARCNCCGKMIQVGTQYEYSSGLWEGEFFQVKTCNLCVQDRLKIVKHELAEGCNWSDAWPNTDEQHEWFQDHPQARRATVHVDLKAASEKLERFCKRIRERQAVV